MTEIVLPCPKCQASLLVDDDNAGSEVICPGCEVHLVLPRDLSGNAMPAVKGEPVRAAGPPPKRNYPLHRSGNAGAADDPADAAPPAKSHLPGRRGLTTEEEMRRLAALNNDPRTFDLHNVDTRGRSAFPCPACHRPVWISRDETGATLKCESCEAEIVAPSNDQPARLARSAENAPPRSKTVLPARRQVEDMPAGEPGPAGRARKQYGHMPAPRESPSPPAADGDSRPLDVHGRIEPIPARGDVELSGAVHRGPAVPVRSAAELMDIGDPEDASGPGGHGHRLGANRVATFTPRHEADLSAEATGAWGSEAPAEHSPAFRRIFTAAIILLSIAGISLAVFFLRGAFAPAPKAGPAADSAGSRDVEAMHACIDSVRRYLDSDVLEDMAKVVRHPAETLPRMRRYYTGSPPVKREVDFTAAEWLPTDLGPLHFVGTTVKLDSSRELDVFLEVPSQGPPLIDWEHMVSWADIPWRDFLANAGEEPCNYRLRVKVGDYYNLAFADGTRYACFECEDPEKFGKCFAYCEAGSETLNQIVLALRAARHRGSTEDGVEIANCILRLRFPPEGRKSNQAWIDAFVQDGWVVP